MGLATAGEILIRVVIPAELKRTIEGCEAEAFRDLFAAAPQEYATEVGLSLVCVNEVTATVCRDIPFVHFNAVLELGLARSVDEETLDGLLAMYATAGVASPAVLLPEGSASTRLLEWLRARGFSPRGAWDRIYRSAAAARLADLEPTSTTEARESSANQVGDRGEDGDQWRVSVVTKSTAAEWAAFLESTYRMKTAPWLCALVDRPGWSHYVLREAGEILAARSAFVAANGHAWFGIDAPVPGLMTQRFDRDLALCRRMVRDLDEHGACAIVTDVEACSPERATAPYVNFASLGFEHAYAREIWRRG